MESELSRGMNRRRRLYLAARSYLLVLVLSVGATLPVVASGQDFDFLLEGVAAIAGPGAPGPLCVYGPRTFAVVVGATADARAPVVAAGRWQNGRVVVLGHDGYFQPATLAKADTGRLMTNALQWAAGDAATGGPRIGVAGSPELLAWLTEAGHNAVEAALTPESLGTIDAVAVVMWNQSGPEVDALSAVIRAGGGLVTASTGWGWAYLHPELDLVNDYAGNRLLASVGIQWPYDWLAPTSPQGYAVDGPPHELTHAGAAFDAVQAHATGTRALTPAEIDQALDSVVRASGCLPPNATLLARLDALVENTELVRWPSEEQPVSNPGPGHVRATAAGVWLGRLPARFRRVPRTVGQRAAEERR